MPYLYHSNISPQDRFDQIEFQMDNGDSVIINRGHSYNLSFSEVKRASRFVVMKLVSTSDSIPTLIERLPVLGQPEDGDVPIWDSSIAAFVPGPMSGGGFTIITQPGDPEPDVDHPEGTTWIEVIS